MRTSAATAAGLLAVMAVLGAACGGSSGGAEAGDSAETAAGDDTASGAQPSDPTGTGTQSDTQADTQTDTSTQASAAGNGEGGQGDAGAPAAPEPTGWVVDGQSLRFVDRTEESGVAAADIGLRAHAIAAGDVDGDGWTDVFLGTFADRPSDDYAHRGADGPSPDRLLRGGPDGFTLDESFPGLLGRTSGATMADLDGDGDLDLVVSRNVGDGEGSDAPSEVLGNDDGAFTRASVLDERRGGRAVGTLDYDGDGLEDIILVEDRWTGGSTALFHNDGNLSFSEVTSEVGVPASLAGLGLGIGDFDMDGHDDFFVGGDNRLFMWRDGGFVEAPSEQFQWETFGDEDDVAHVAVADVQGDGMPDLVVGQHYNSTLDFGEEVPVRLYLNEGISDGWPRFRDVTEQAGLAGLPTKAPRVLVDDLNGDGWTDIVTTASAGDGSTAAVFWGAEPEDGVPQFTSPEGLGAAQYWIDAVILDADQDRVPDLFLVEWEPELGSRLLAGEPAG